MATKLKKKKRIRPVIEEVVEDKPDTAAEPVVSETTEVSPSPVSLPEPVVEASEPEEEDLPVAADSALETPSLPERKTNIKMILVITVVSALVAAFVSGGVYVYLNGINELGSTPAETSTPTPESSPVASPSPTPDTSKDVDVSTLSVSVLNGSGAIGAAGKGQGILEDAGFTVEHTGNAANYNFKSTTIQVKNSVEASVVSRLKDALSASYEVEIGDALTSSSKYDIVVTVGAN